ncbi:MAG: VCBS repeat-containing protein, partial [Planctomycetota bacterium]
MPSSKLPRGAFDARASLVAATLGLGLPAAAGAAQAVPPVSAPPVAPSAVSESELVGAELPPAPDVEASVLWVDWSGDGKDDVWAVQPDGSGLLLQNAGDGTFSDRTPGSGLIDVTGIHRAAWADVDRDGRLDVFLGSWNGPSYLFLQSGDGTFVDVTRASGLSPQVRPVEAQWIDFDGDGWLDLHLANLREDVVYRGLGRAQFERVELGLVPRVSLPSGVVPFPSTGVGSIDPYGAPDAARPIGSGASLGSSSGSITSITGTSANPSGSSSSICAGSIEDLAGGACLNASSAPQLGMLYPLS